MEFSFQVTEPEFKQAWRAERKASSRSSLKTAIFWILIMMGLLLLYRALQPSRAEAGVATRHRISRAMIVQPAGDINTPGGFAERVGPFLVIAGIWILLVTALVPMRLRSLYQRDPRMRGKFTVNVTQDSISTENTAGTTSKCAWSVYEYWCEGKGVIVLMFHSGTYSILSLAGLSELQLGELRGILSAALPRR
jgi:hypothetical protein